MIAVLICGPILIAVLIGVVVLLTSKPRVQMEGRETDLWKHSTPPSVQSADLNS